MNTYCNFKNALAVLLLSFLYACQNDDCEMTKNGEDVTLSEEILDLVSNYQNADRIIFKDQNGSDIEFNILSTTRKSEEYQYSIKCQEDTTIFQGVKGNSEWMELIIKPEDSNFDSIFFTILELPNPNTEEFKESLTISCGKLLSNSPVQENVLFGFTEESNEVKFFDSIKIRGKTFYDAYEPQNLSWTPKLDIRFTKNEGIISISNPNTSTELIYDRKE